MRGLFVEGLPGVEHFVIRFIGVGPLSMYPYGDRGSCVRRALRDVINVRDHPLA
jgi:hypothetical protein